jgi:glycosyltransferase involved in cell wall biosynthesis
MKILFVNKYFYPKGGSEISMFETAKILQAKGHEIVYFSMKDDRNLSCDQEEYFISEVNYEGNAWSKVDASLKLLYSLEAKKRIEELIREEKPDIAHLNNIYHQISPSIIHSLTKFGIPQVMTLHDYKMVCASYALLNSGQVCEACKNGKYYYCLLRGCVKNSLIRSALNMFEMYLHHDILRIYDGVDVFISPYSTYFENKLREMGFQGNIVHIQNFLRLQEYKPEYGWEENSIAYFGRLSNEKGVLTLIRAMQGITDVSLKVIGEGPMEEELRNIVQKENIQNVRFLGHRTGEDLKNEIRKSKFVVVPSEWYEPFALTIIEAFALGKPVIGARIGGIPERVIDEETGLLFEMGNVHDLRSKIEHLLNEGDSLRKMGRKARIFVEKEFGAERHYEKLISIYETALQRHRSAAYCS